MTSESYPNDAAPNTSEQLHLFESVPTSEGTDFDERIGSIQGLSRAINARLDSKAEVHVPSQDAQVYMDAGTSSLTVRAPQKEYDPLKGFDKTHMSKRAGFGEIAPPPEDRSMYPTTTLQEMQVVRANLRVDAINRRERQIARFTSLYGDALHDKETTAAVIDSGRYTKSQKAAIRKANRYVMRSEKENDRANKRLNKTIEGKDIPGRLTTTHDKTVNKVTRASRKLVMGIGTATKSAGRKAGNVTKSGVKKVLGW